MVAKEHLVSAVEIREVIFQRRGTVRTALLLREQEAADCGQDQLLSSFWRQCIVALNCKTKRGLGAKIDMWARRLAAIGAKDMGEQVDGK